MNNPTLDLIHKHASVRRYKADPLPTAVIETVIQAAQCASTSSNMQAYSVVAVTDPAKRERLSALCAEQEFIAEAPVFLAWVADLALLDRVCELRGYTQVTEHVESFLVPAVDCALAAQTAALAAESLGLGICYVGSIRNNPQEVIALLGLPLHTFPIVGMTLGWPAKESNLKPRLPLPAILHWESYHTDQDATLLDYDRTMAATGIYEGHQVPAPGKPDVMENYGWLEHSARRAARVVRTGMREVLEKQGFGLK
ncbi:MAG: NADPH-dependent oxidoreductase [Candidatus Atribacteria bacterium]|nr:NADPH-dependent oxidoreductase [Candidatus Atribacteria bacterium]